MARRVEPVRVAMREAVRRLGRKTVTAGRIGTARGTPVAVQDARDVPEEDREAVESASARRPPGSGTVFLLGRLRR